MEFTILKKEWDTLIKKELRYIDRHKKEKTSFIQTKLEKIVPPGLQNTLEKAFIKGFHLVFQKGTFLIEKTYKKEEYEKDYKINEYTASVKANRKSLKAFRTKARNINRKNTLLSGVEGVALGAAGIGIPDIPLFLGVLLKSLYEISLSFGFSYENPREQLFILKLIETAIYYGEDFDEKDEVINEMITNSNKIYKIEDININSSIEQTAKALSKELLYMKFLQGIPVAGIIGGLSDITCQQAVTEYAMLKYEKRFLLNKLNKI